MSPSESDIQKQILDWLKIKRVFHYRQNTGVMRADKRFIRFGVPGAPDIVAVINGRFIGIEVKKDGKEQSQAQIDFEGSLKKAGAIYILAHTLDDVIKGLQIGK